MTCLIYYINFFSIDVMYKKESLQNVLINYSKIIKGKYINLRDVYITYMYIWLCNVPLRIYSTIKCCILCHMCFCFLQAVHRIHFYKIHLIV